MKKNLILIDELTGEVFVVLLGCEDELPYLTEIEACWSDITNPPDGRIWTH